MRAKIEVFQADLHQFIEDGMIQAEIARKLKIHPTTLIPHMKLIDAEHKTMLRKNQRAKRKSSPWGVMHSPHLRNIPKGMEEV
tara:strand:- start:5329 stop:5577 length:249 start_codon:yes stop_codon:yes gene_type:complete